MSTEASAEKPSATEEAENNVSPSQDAHETVTLNTEENEKQVKEDGESTDNAKQCREKESDKIENTHDDGLDSTLTDPNTIPKESATFQVFKDVKLIAKSMVGSIHESEDDPSVSDASQKLDTYREQISLLVKTAAAWTKTMAQTWSNQQRFTNQLNECHLVMKTFDTHESQTMSQNDSDNENENENENKIGKSENNNDDSNDIDNENDKKENYNNEKEKSENEKSKNEEKSKNKKLPFGLDLDNTRHFSNVVKRISQELHLDDDYSKRYENAEKLLVKPLENILKHEIEHGIEIRKKYLRCKRQYDECCTNIQETRDRIDEFINPPTKQDIVAQSTTMKFKSAFSRMFRTETKEDLENRLKLYKQQLPQLVKNFDQAKIQLLEAIGIIEQKLNIEVVYYVQQFYEYVQSWNHQVMKESASAIEANLNVSNGKNNGNKDENDRNVPIISADAKDLSLENDNSNISPVAVNDNDNDNDNIDHNNNNNYNNNDNNNNGNNNGGSNENTNELINNIETNDKNSKFTRMDTVNLMTPMSEADTESAALPIG